MPQLIFLINPKCCLQTAKKTVSRFKQTNLLAFFLSIFLHSWQDKPTSYDTNVWRLEHPCPIGNIWVIVFFNDFDKVTFTSLCFTQ